MFTEMAKRPYRMKKRARDQARTRQRIVDAAVELHGSLGPKNTSISAVAELAGVQRLTVYRHFPDEFALFRACTSHWLGEHPPPDPAAWQDVAAPAARTEAALAALYAYYRQTADMWELTYRDAGEVEAVQGPLREFEAYLDRIRGDLLAAWHPQGRKPQGLKAAVAHALAFSTWSSLRGQGLGDAPMSRLVAGWVGASAG